MKYTWKYVLLMICIISCSVAGFSSNGLPEVDSSKNELYLKKLSEDTLGKGEPLSVHSTGDNDVPSDEMTGYRSVWMAMSMIALSELGDKTFLVAAIMAMKNPRLLVFSSAFASLSVMTVLSGVVGHALPTLISQKVTQFLASVLFLIFAIRLLREGYYMPKGFGVEEEIAEVEDEIATSNINIELSDMERGHSRDHAIRTLNSTYDIMKDSVLKLVSHTFSPVWIQVFVMTFLGEWGDRSQIATIAMAAGSNYWYVIVGAIIGHGLCTMAACIGGKLLASKISMRNITLGGSVIFFLFAALYFYDSYSGGN